MHFYDNCHNYIKKTIEIGIIPNLVIDRNEAYIIDPVYGIIRNRVNAEIAKTLFRLFLINRNDMDHDLAFKLINYLVNRQNHDGSWNEIHVKYNEKSALITSIVGESLIELIVNLQNKNIKCTNNFTYDYYFQALNKAKNYVLNNQISNGFFRKSSLYTADFLNVDATCGAFLAKYGDVFSDKKCIEVAKNTIEHIFTYQSEDGSIPYTTENKGNYSYSMQIPCIHYQGVTIYYLLKVIYSLKTNEYDSYFKKAILWLKNVQLYNGKFDWSKSGLMFAYYLSGAYAFAIPCFVYALKWNKQYESNIDMSFKLLEQNTSIIVNRWEKESMLTFPKSVSITAKSALIGNYPIKHIFFRFGYGIYRQFARRRFSNNVNPKIFRFLSGIMNIDTSTIEPDNNFPDLFMTSEVLDCLSYSLVINYINME